MYFDNAGRLFYSDDRGQTWIGSAVAGMPANFAGDPNINPIIYYDGFYYGFQQAYISGGI